MKINIILVFFILSVLQLSCNGFMQGDEFIVRKSPTLSVSVKSMSDNSISFIVRASWHNGCGRFSHFDFSKSDSTCFITVYGQQPKDAVCTQALITFEAPVEIPINKAGKYIFRFWQSDSTSLDTVINFAG